jgi:hypothetical protein
LLSGVCVYTDRRGHTSHDSSRCHESTSRSDVHVRREYAVRTVGTVHVRFVRYCSEFSIFSVFVTRFRRPRRSSSAREHNPHNATVRGAEVPCWDGDRRFGTKVHADTPKSC